MRSVQDIEKAGRMKSPDATARIKVEEKIMI